MKKYIYQKFLLQCDYDQVEMREIPNFHECLEDVFEVGMEYNLFDVGQNYRRKISLTEMDNTIDTFEDWNSFISAIRGLDELIIYNNVPNSNNRIITDYRLATLKAYVYRIQKDCKQVKLYYNQA